MTKHIFCFLAMLIAARSSFSQDCTEATLIQKPGDWKEGLKGSTSGVSTADLAREKNVVTALHTMIKSKYIPMAVSAGFSWWV